MQCDGCRRGKEENPVAEDRDDGDDAVPLVLATSKKAQIGVRAEPEKKA